jgi:hypothetical protein
MNPADGFAAPIDLSATYADWESDRDFNDSPEGKEAERIAKEMGVKLYDYVPIHWSQDPNYFDGVYHLTAEHMLALEVFDEASQLSAAWWAKGEIRKSDYTRASADNSLRALADYFHRVHKMGKVCIGAFADALNAERDKILDRIDAEFGITELTAGEARKRSPNYGKGMPETKDELKAIIQNRSDSPEDALMQVLGVDDKRLN